MALGLLWSVVRFFSERFIVAVAFCVTTQTATSSLAADPAFTSKLPRDSELVLLSGDKIYRTGRFVTAHDTTLTLKTFDSGKDRFQEEHIALDQITEALWIQHHRSVAYPVGLSIFLGTLGALIGYNAFDDGSNPGGDTDVMDQRGVAALGLGVTGFAFGFILGAMIAPETRTETSVWTRD